MLVFMPCLSDRCKYQAALWLQQHNSQAYICIQLEESSSALDRTYVSTAPRTVPEPDIANLKSPVARQS